MDGWRDAGDNANIVRPTISENLSDSVRRAIEYGLRNMSSTDYNNSAPKINSPRKPANEGELFRSASSSSTPYSQPSIYSGHSFERCNTDASGGTGEGGTVTHTCKGVGEMENQLALLEQRLEALCDLPTNKDFLNKEHLQPQNTPANEEMGQVVQLNNRVVAAESAIQKMTTLIEALANEIRNVQVNDLEVTDIAEYVSGTNSQRSIIDKCVLTEHTIDKAVADLKKEIRNIGQEWKKEVDRIQQVTGVDVSGVITPTLMKGTSQEQMDNGNDAQQSEGQLIGFSGQEQNDGCHSGDPNQQIVQQLEQVVQEREQTSAEIVNNNAMFQETNLLFFQVAQEYSKLIENPQLTSDEYIKEVKEVVQKFKRILQLQRKCPGIIFGEETDDDIIRGFSPLSMHHLI